MKTRLVSMVVAAVLVGMLSLGGCPLTPTPVPYAGDLDAALAQAQTLAQNWNADAKLSAIIGSWVHADTGKLDTAELADNPCWGFSFLAPDGLIALGVTILPDGTATTPVTEAVQPVASHPIGQYKASDMQAFVRQGLLHYAEHPAPKANTDVVLMVGYSPTYRQEQVIVGVYDEADQATDYGQPNWWSGLVARAHALVRIDPATHKVVRRSWDPVDLDAALMIAETQADAWDANNKITGIFGTWVHPTNADLNSGEPEDDPRWGFSFINEAGTKSFGLTVLPNGSITTPVEESITTLTTVPIRNYNAVDLEGFVQVALDAYAQSPAPFPVYDMIVAVGYSPTKQREVATVLIFAEADQNVDYNGVNWLTTLLTQADDSIKIDPVTGAVLSKTW